MEITWFMNIIMIISGKLMVGYFIFTIISEKKLRLKLCLRLWCLLFYNKANGFKFF